MQHYDILVDKMVRNQECINQEHFDDYPDLGNFKNSLSAVELLVNHGADIEAKDDTFLPY